MTFNANKQGVDMEFYPVHDDSELGIALDHCKGWILQEFHDNPRAVSATIQEARLNEELRIIDFGKVITSLDKTTQSFR